MTQQEMIKKMQEIGFSLVELNLFLDTHPENTEARTQYNRYAEQLARLRAQYNAAFGPTMNFGLCEAKNAWSWIDEPWPWEN